MFGTETAQFKDTQSSAYIRSKFRNFNRERGVVIRACEDVFECIAHRRMAAGKQGTLPVVFVCECVRVICPPLKSTDRRAHMFGLYNATSVCAVHDDGVSSVRVIALPSVIHDIWRRCGIMHVHQRPVCRCHVCLIQCNGMRHAPGARCVFCVCTVLGLHYDAEISVTYVEIFGDAILDLLDDGQAVAHTKAAVRVAQNYIYLFVSSRCFHCVCLCRHMLMVALMVIVSFMFFVAGRQVRSGW